MRKKVSLCKIHKGLHALTVSPYRDILDHQARTAWTYSFSQRGKGVWLFALWFLCFLVSARLLSSNEWLLRCGQVCCFWVLTCFYRGDTPSPGLGREDMQKLQMTQGWEEPGCTDTCIRHALPLPSWLISLIHRQNELMKCLNPVFGCHHFPLLLKARGHHLPGQCTHRPQSIGWPAKTQSCCCLVSLQDDRAAKSTSVTIAADCFLEVILQSSGEITSSFIEYCDDFAVCENPRRYWFEWFLTVPSLLNS